MRSKKHLFFTGIKHSGKTTFAKMISRKWNWSFFDSDDLIEENLKGQTIRDFYKENGKEAFMSLEAENVKKLLLTPPESFILSFGGGASDNTLLMNIIKENGYSIYLKRDECDMLSVILQHGVPPFLDEKNIEQSFHEIYTKRDEIYRRYADLTINLGPYGDKNSTALYIEKTLKENGYGF